MATALCAACNGGLNSEPEYSQVADSALVVCQHDRLHVNFVECRQSARRKSYTRRISLRFVAQRGPTLPGLAVAFEGDEDAGQENEAESSEHPSHAGHVIAGLAIGFGIVAAPGCVNRWSTSQATSCISGSK